MGLKLTAILLLVIFVTLQFGGRETPSGPFAEMPGATPETALADVKPLDKPLEAHATAEAAVFTTTTAPEKAAAALAGPAEVAAAPETLVAPDEAATPNVAETARATLDLTVIDPRRVRDNLTGTEPAETGTAATVGGSAALAALGGATAAPEAGAEADTPAASSDGAPDIAEVTGTVGHLRAGPSTENAVVGQARAGERVEWVSEPAPGWALIRHPDLGEAAYMSSAYLRRIAN